MPDQQVFIPAKRRVHRRRRPVVSSSPAPAGPVLVSAEFVVTDGAYLVMTFDRAIDVSALDVAAFAVLRHPSEERFDGSTVELTDPTTVTVGLANVESTTPGDDVVMNVAADNGIVAVDGGDAWAGATGVILPFP